MWDHLYVYVMLWLCSFGRLVVLSFVLFGLPYSSEQSCSVTLVDHGRGYLGILVSCLICESAIMWLSMRGSILYTQPREAVQYVLYIRLGKTHTCTFTINNTTEKLPLVLSVRWISNVSSVEVSMKWKLAIIMITRASKRIIIREDMSLQAGGN